jgi:predicted transcriptional regulator
MKPSEIEQRRQRIRLPKKALAQRAGLDQGTVGRALEAETNPLRGTVEKIEREILAEELALRDHLVALHPLPADAVEKVPA